MSIGTAIAEALFLDLAAASGYIGDGQRLDRNQRRPAHKGDDIGMGKNGDRSDPVTGFHRHDPLAPDRLNLSQQMLSQGMPSLSRSSLPPQGQFCRYQRASAQLPI